MNRVLLAAIVIGAGCGGAAAYVLFGRPSDAPTASLAADPRAVVPSAEAPAAPTARLAATVPHFELVDRAGQRRSLGDWQGKALVVNFWATWCAPCRREIPLLGQIARDRADEGFEVIGIAVDYRDKVLEFADEMKIEYPLLIGEQDALDAAAAFGVEAIGFPFTIFTDVQGRVVAAQMGELEADEAALILDEVAEVNAGRRTPTEARRRIEADLSARQHDTEPEDAG
jgi:thiol-disulfide isomerase/thioredoxin